MSIEVLAVLTATALGVVVAVWLRVWSPRLLRGPSRLGRDEPLAALVMVMCVGFLTLIFAQAGMETFFGPKPTSLQTTISQTVAQAATIAAIWLAGNRVRGADARRVGLDVRPGRLVHGLLAAIPGCCIALPATIWAMEISQWISQRAHQMHPLLKALHDHPSPAMRIWVTISAVVTAPLWEELFFRAYLQTTLREFTHRPWLALVIAAALFASQHPMWSWPAIFVLALCLGYAYERTGNLWTCILMHAMFNGTELMLLRTSG